MAAVDPSLAETLKEQDFFSQLSDDSSQKFLAALTLYESSTPPTFFFDCIVSR